jgi:hypothetical protein
MKTIESITTDFLQGNCEPMEYRNALIGAIERLGATELEVLARLLKDGMEHMK